MVDFRILGPLEVFDGDRVLDLGGARQRLLLARLVVAANRVVSLETLLDELWGDHPSGGGRDALHAGISRARKALGDPLRLVSHPPGYRLAVAPEELDAGRFEHLLSQARAGADAGDLESAAMLLREAEALWRGPALAEFSDHPFAQAESARLEELRVRATEERIDAELALGRHARAVVDLEALVAAHPFRERFWGQLMLALYRSGRQAEALRAFQQLRRCLGEELGIEPSSEIQRLEQAILVQDATLDAPAGANARLAEAAPARPAPGVPAAGALPFVGRETELSQLASIVDGWRGGVGRPCVALVQGDAGSGKTRFLQEFAHWCRRQGVLTVTGRADGMPYQAFKGAVRELLRALDDPSGDRLGELAGSLGVLLPELGVAVPEAADPALARLRLFEAVARALELVTGTGPLVLILDDVHWLDEGSAALLRALVARQWTRPPLIVAAHRPLEGADDVRALLVDVVTQDDTVCVQLGRLAPTDLHRLVRQLSPDREEAAVVQLAARVQAATGGLPLLVREVLRSIGAGDEAAAERALSATPLAQAVIGRSLDRLSPPARALLRAGAAIGRQLDIALLVALTGQSEDDVIERLDEARAVGGIVQDVPHVDAIAFEHELVREVLASGLSDVHRRRLHGRAAELLGGRGLSVRAAQHALAAVPPMPTARAAEMVAGGADQAFGMLAFESARELCQRALDTLGADLGPGDRVSLLRRLGRAHALCGHPEEAEAAWWEAAAAARKSDDPEELAAVALTTDEHARMVYPSELRWTLLQEAFEALAPGWPRARLLVGSALIAEAATPVRRLLMSGLAEELLTEARSAQDDAVLAPAVYARHVLARGGVVADRRPWARSGTGGRPGPSPAQTARSLSPTPTDRGAPWS